MDGSICLTDQKNDNFGHWAELRGPKSTTGVPVLSGAIERSTGEIGLHSHLEKQTIND